MLSDLGGIDRKVQMNHTVKKKSAGKLSANSLLCFKMSSHGLWRALKERKIVHFSNTSSLLSCFEIVLVLTFNYKIGMDDYTLVEAGTEMLLRLRHVSGAVRINGK